MLYLYIMKDIFVSYSSKDESVAKNVCRFLESSNMNCWVAYRDIQHGKTYASEILRGIKETKITLLLFSKNSNASEHVLNEIDYAFTHNKIIVPFKLEETEMSDELLYYLSRKQWIPASRNYIDQLPSLVDLCYKYLGRRDSTTTLKVNFKPKWADYVSKEQKMILSNLIHNMIYVEAGSFKMGATAEQKKDSYEWEKPVHDVTLSDFYISKSLITQEIWQSIMSNNPSSEKGTNLPVINVTWEDCIDFIQKLNELTGLQFKLPTEAQWEYAARGGNKSKGYKYSGSDNINDVAWCWHAIQTAEGLHPVCEKLPNELGIYDMSGCVWEWCNDWYYIYDGNPVTDPFGAISGTRKVMRGGSSGIYSGPNCCRVSYRIGRIPKYKDNYLGFRVVL